MIEAVQATPVVVLEGARAVGKSTMCDELVARGHLAARVSLTAGGLEDITSAMDRIRDDLSNLGSPAPSGSSARMMRAWATRTGEVMEPAATQLAEAVTELRRRWNDLDEVVVGLVRLAGTLPPRERVDRLTELLDPIDDLRGVFDDILGSSELAELGHNLTAVAAASRRLRPLSRSVESALALIAEMRASTEVWLGMRSQ